MSCRLSVVPKTTTVRHMETVKDVLGALDIFDQLPALYRRINGKENEGLRYPELSDRHRNRFIFILEGNVLVATATVVLVETSLQKFALVEDIAINGPSILEDQLIEEAETLARKSGCTSIRYFQMGFYRHHPLS